MPETEVTVVPNDIRLYLHCKRCVQEWKDGKASGESPATYARISVGLTQNGLQVWCLRHDLNVTHIDFEGQVHPAR